MDHKGLVHSSPFKPLYMPEGNQKSPSDSLRSPLPVGESRDQEHLTKEKI
jgi:hypothetical protein